MSTTNVLFHGTSIDGSPLFALPATIELVSGCHKAVQASRTWGDFRRLMPAAELSHVIEAMEDNETPMPEDSETFGSDLLPGFADGEWPAWIKQTMLQELPEEVQELGAVETSTLNGSYLELEPSALPRILDRLKQLGWTVVERPDLMWEPE